MESFGIVTLWDELFFTWQNFPREYPASFVTSRCFSAHWDVGSTGRTHCGLFTPRRLSGSSAVSALLKPLQPFTGFYKDVSFISLNAQTCTWWALSCTRSCKRSSPVAAPFHIPCPPTNVGDQVPLHPLDSIWCFFTFFLNFSYSSRYVVTT